jgi:TonB family protein
MGEIFDLTGQRARAVNEYRQAVETRDDSEGAQMMARQLLENGGNGDDAGLHHVLYPQIRYVRIPKPIVKVPAEYSPEARIAELEGTVSFLATVQADGSVKDLRLMSRLGLGLDEAAKMAAERWLFEPGAGEEGAEVMMANIEVNFSLPTRQSLWHLHRVVFSIPEGGTRPSFVKTSYPVGDGVSAAAEDAVRLLAAMGRQAFVTLSFDVNEDGRPVHFQIERAREPTWGKEAISIVSGWRFTPGSKDGKALSVLGTLDLVWGDKQWTHESRVGARAASYFRYNGMLRTEMR